MNPTIRLLAAVAIVAGCSRPPVVSPRYSIDIFSEDTLQAHVTVKVDSPTMEVFLQGAGFYTINKEQPVVLTPASLSVRGTGTATISSVDSMQIISVVPSGTHPDSTDAKVTIGRMLRVVRSPGESAFKLEVARP